MHSLPVGSISPSYVVRKIQRPQLAALSACLIKSLVTLPGLRGLRPTTKMKYRGALPLAGCDPMLPGVSAVTGGVILSVTPDKDPGTSNENTPGSVQGKWRPGVPPVPDVLVGEQNDPRAGPTQGGNRHTSGPLAPQFGGVGNIRRDFDYLTGGTGKPFPGSDSRSRIPGAVVGDNGIWMRPGGTSGGRIEIPPTQNKLRETLHY